MRVCIGSCLALETTALQKVPNASDGRMNRASEIGGNGFVNLLDTFSDVITMAQPRPLFETSNRTLLVQRDEANIERSRVAKKTTNQHDAL